MFSYDAAAVVRSRCPQRPETHAVAKFWFTSPHPYAVRAAACADDVAVERFGPTALVALHEGALDDRRVAMVVTLPLGPSDDVIAPARAILLEGIGRAIKVMQEFQQLV